MLHTLGKPIGSIFELDSRLVQAWQQTKAQPAEIGAELSCGISDRQDSVHILTEKGFSKHGLNENTISNHTILYLN